MDRRTSCQAPRPRQLAKSGLNWSHVHMRSHLRGPKPLLHVGRPVETMLEDATADISGRR